MLQKRLYGAYRRDWEGDNNYLQLSPNLNSMVSMTWDSKFTKIFLRVYYLYFHCEFLFDIYVSRAIMRYKQQELLEGDDST